MNFVIKEAISALANAIISGIAAFWSWPIPTPAGYPWQPTLIAFTAALVGALLGSDLRPPRLILVGGFVLFVYSVTQYTEILSQAGAHPAKLELALFLYAYIFLFIFYALMLVESRLIRMLEKPSVPRQAPNSRSNP